MLLGQWGWGWGPPIQISKGEGIVTEALAECSRDLAGKSFSNNSLGVYGFSL